MNNIIIKKENKFKSMYISFNLLLPLNAEDNSKNALVASILRQGSEKYKTEQEIELELAKNYNSLLNVNLDRIGGTYNIEFGLEVINKESIEEDALENGLQILEQIIYFPLLENNKFKREYVEREKQYLLSKIEEEKNNKRVYALRRLEEEVFEESEYRLNVLGTEKLILKEDEETLYAYYLKILRKAEKKVLIVGNTSGYTNLEELVKKYLFREDDFKNNDNLHLSDSVKIINKNHIEEKTEYQKINQSVLCMGLGIENYTNKDFFVSSIYNAILGETPSSKLFQNVREKESLAYFAKSQYLRHMGVIYIISGINLLDVAKAKKIIIRQLEDMKNALISDEEFNAAKSHIIYSYKALEDKKENIAKMILSDGLLFGDKKIDNYWKISGFEKVEKKDVVGFASKVFVDTIFLLGGKQDE